MNRRKFLKEVFLWTAGLSLTVPRFNIAEKAFADTSLTPLVSVGTGKDYRELVKKVLNPFDSLKSIIKPGDKVVIKPNIGWDRTPDQAANTHPVIVQELAGLAMNAGAKKVLIFDRTCNESRRCYERSGIRPAILDMKNKNVKIEYMDRRKYVPVDIKKGKSLQRWEFYKDALEADCYINVPVAKHHGLAKLTLGLKNAMGVIGGSRGKLHWDLGEKLADLATVIRPQLTVIDATRILLKHGPQGGNLKDVKVLDTLIATIDPVAADAYATTLFGREPHEIKSTMAAYKRGLGQMDLNKMQIVKS
jgi:uncharacterized protein (DUF362 family)